MVMAFSKFILNEVFQNFILMNKSGKQRVLWEKVPTAKLNDLRLILGTQWYKEKT